MLYAGSLGTALFVGSVLALSGCAHNTYAIANMSPSELKVVSDADLCYAQRYWQTPQLLSEIGMRRLDCRTGTRVPEPKPVAKKKPKSPSKPASGVAVGTVAKPAPSNAEAQPPESS